MRIPSGSTDRKIAFIAVDSTDLKTRETGLSSFTVYRSRDGGTPVLYTTPTVAELDATNMPGVYVLTVDEDTTVAAGHDVEEYVVHITQAAMAPVTRAIEIERVKFTEGQTVTAANGAVDADVERVQGAVVSTSTAQLGVNVVSLSANAITAAAINAGAITSAKFAAGAIDAAAIATDAIDADAIADNAINAAAIAAGAITAAKFAAGAIDAAAIATDAIDGDAIATSAVTEIQSGLATASALSTAQADLDDIQTRLPAALTSGTADSGTTTTMVDAARTEADADYWKGCLIRFTSGTISGQVRLITGFTPGSDTMTFTPATTQAVSTQTYEILPAGAVDVRLWNGSAPNSLVSGRVDASVGAVAAGAIDAAAIATDAIDGDAIAASAVTEIQSGLATSAALATVQADTDDIQARLPAALVGGRMDSNVQAMAADVITSTSLATSAVNEVRDSILSDATPFAGANVNASIASRATPADVNAQVLDVLDVDTFAPPPQESPPATTTLRRMLSYLYKMMRHRKTQTASEFKLFADDGTTVDQKATFSDDTITSDRGKLVSGP